MSELSENKNTCTANNCRNIETGVAFAIFCLLADQLHKFMMLDILDFENIRIMEVTPFLNLVMVWNRGISFGLFQDIENSNYFFIGFTSIIILIIFFMLRCAKTKAEAIGYGMIIGGAIGNLTDRIRLGAVADFFDFHIVGKHWPAFNIADSCVFIGAAILIFTTIKCQKGCKKNEK